MNIYEEKLIIVGGWRLWERWRQTAGGVLDIFSFQNSFAGLPQPVPTRPVLQHPIAGREEGLYRLEAPVNTQPPPQIWWQPLCPSKWQTSSLPAVRSPPPHSHNCVMEVFLNCNLITILIALNAIMMGNKQEESGGGGG